MVKRRYSNSRKGKSRRGKKCRHTKRHMRRGHRRTRRGGQTPGPPTLVTYLKQNEPLTSGMRSFQTGGSETSTGGNMVYKGGEWISRNHLGGRT